MLDVYEPKKGKRLGAYSTRLNLETIGGVFAYYDELFFRFHEVDVQ